MKVRHSLLLILTQVELDKPIKVVVQISEVGDGKVAAPGQLGRRTVELHPGQRRENIWVHTVDDTVRVNDNDAAPQPWPAVSISDAQIQEDA
ncbi:MAG: hypothetical protein OXD47_09935, partial [Gammaproteobacteria bacterium]|nr:hypothetical protein [Gammaproteobacteria bacterium]